ncbi:MAG: GUN4 domain-containing protein [Cyanobacteria bacterium J06627_28]
MTKTITDLIITACLIGMVGIAIAFAINWLMLLPFKIYKFRLQRRSKKEDLEHLEHLLSEKQWAAADRETSKIIARTTRFSYCPVITIFFMLVFPHHLLLAIDQLWTHYSQGRFGFSAQREVYETVVGSNIYWNQSQQRRRRPYFLTTSSFINELQLEKPVKICFLDFADTVGWRINKQWYNYQNFPMEEPMPKGYLPVGQWLPTVKDIVFQDPGTPYNRSIVFAALMYRLGEAD